MAQLLSETGGIGRRVHKSVMASQDKATWVFPPGKKRTARVKDEARSAASQFSRLMQCMRIAATDRDRCERCIARINDGTVTSIDPEDIQARRDHVTRAMDRLGYPAPEISEQIDRWIDTGFLYDLGGGTDLLQLAIPADVKIIFANVPTRDDLVAAQTVATFLKYQKV